MLLNVISLVLIIIMGFAVIAAVVVLRCSIIASQKYIANYLIYYLTLSLGILAVVLLTVTDHLGDSVVGSILSGIFGYVLGRHTRDGNLDSAYAPLTQQFKESRIYRRHSRQG